MNIDLSCVDQFQVSYDPEMLVSYDPEMLGW